MVRYVSSNRLLERHWHLNLGIEGLWDSCLGSQTLECSGVGRGREANALTSKYLLILKLIDFKNKVMNNRRMMLRRSL